MSRFRTGIPGVKGLSKVENEASWGGEKALERTRDYRKGAQDVTPPMPDTFAAEHGAERGNMHVQGRDVDWADDVPVNSWLRGGGTQAAEGKPNFDHRKNPNDWPGGNNPKLKGGR